MWELQWGGRRKFLERRAESRGDLPKALKNQPQLHASLQPVWDAWCNLSLSRQSGFDLNPISVQDAAAYLTLVGFEGEIAVMILKLVQRMDMKYLEFVRDKRAAIRTAEKAKTDAHSRTRNRR